MGRTDFKEVPRWEAGTHWLPVGLKRHIHTQTDSSVVDTDTWLGLDLSCDGEESTLQRQEP